MGRISAKGTSHYTQGCSYVAILSKGRRSGWRAPILSSKFDGGGLPLPSTALALASHLGSIQTLKNVNENKKQKILPDPGSNHLPLKTVSAILPLDYPPPRDCKSFGDHPDAKERKWEKKQKIWPEPGSNRRPLKTESAILPLD